MSTPTTSPNASASATTSPTASRDAAARRRVAALLTGIPEPTDHTLGRAGARVTITEYGDLECSVCDVFAVAPNARTSDGTSGSGIEDRIITTLIRTGQAKLDYDALETATSGGATPGEFIPQQAAVLAAGRQHRAWWYLELFYNEQQPEGTDYVTPQFLEHIAAQSPGLNLARWREDLDSAPLRAQVTAENKQGDLIDADAPGTPTIMVETRSNGGRLSEGIPTYAAVRDAVRSLSR